MGVRKKKDYYKRIQRFRIIDDDFMRVVLKDKACTQQVLEVITEKDVLGGGKAVYHIHRTIEETGKKFGDGTHIIYINAKIQDETPVGKLMHDFLCTRAEDMYYPVLADKVRHLKEDEKEVETMCRIMEEIEERGMRYGEKNGIDRVSKLVDILLSQNRIEDLQRSTSDRVYQRRLFQEFGI